MSSTPHEHHPRVAAVIERNVRALSQVRRHIESKKSAQDRIAQKVTRFSGSLLFFYLNACWFIIWGIVNLGLTPITPFDPFPFGLLTVLVSLEAIFLSTFVLITQNRMAALSDQRADLDLQVDLLTEYEVTKILRIVDAIADHLKLHEGRDKELPELEAEVTPENILREIEAHNHGEKHS